MEERDGAEAPLETGKAPREAPGRGGRRRALIGCGIAAAALVVGLGIAWATGSLGPAATLPAEGGEPVEVEPAREDADLGEVMSGLTYSGRDVSLEYGDVTVTAKGGRVMVEERADSDAVTRVDLSARRCAALAHALDGETVRGDGVTDVTWVACDPEGSVKFAVTNDVASEAASKADDASDAADGGQGAAVGSATADSSDADAGNAPAEGTAEGDGGPGPAVEPAPGPTEPGTAEDGAGSGAVTPSEPTTSEVVSGSTGWTMSDDTRDGLSGAAPDLPQQGGQAPTTPDGEAVTPGAAAPDQPEVEQPNEGEGTGQGDCDGASAHQPASSDPSGGGAGSAGSGSPSGGQASGPTGGTGSSGSSPGGSSAPVHEHSWQAVTATRWVQDSAAWDETVVVSEAWDESVPVYGTRSVIRCTWCGSFFASHDEFIDHNDSVHDGEASYNVTKQQVQTGTTTKHHDAVTKTVHHDATGHNETYVTGYRCSGCGATK